MNIAVKDNSQTSYLYVKSLDTKLRYCECNIHAMKPVECSNLTHPLNKWLCRNCFQMVLPRSLEFFYSELVNDNIKEQHE